MKQYFFGTCDEFFDENDDVCINHLAIANAFILFETAAIKNFELFHNRRFSRLPSFRSDEKKKKCKIGSETERQMERLGENSRKKIWRRGQ